MRIPACKKEEIIKVESELVFQTLLKQGYLEQQAPQTRCTVPAAYFLTGAAVSVLCCCNKILFVSISFFHRISAKGI